MNDFKMVLGIEFLNDVRAFPIPSSNTMCIMSEGNTCMLPMAREASIKAKTMSAIQLNKGHKRKQPTYLVILKGNENLLPSKTVVPDEIAQVLEEY